MLLDAKSRLILTGILPKEGDIVTLRLLRELVGKVALSAEELQDLKVVSNPVTNLTTWDTEKDIPKEVEFNSKEVEFIMETMNKLASEKRLPADALDLYDIFDEVQKVHVV